MEKRKIKETVLAKGIEQGVFKIIKYKYKEVVIEIDKADGSRELICYEVE